MFRFRRSARKSFIHTRHRRIGGEERAVDGPDRGPNDDVWPDLMLREGAQHPDLVRAQNSAAAEHEGNLGGGLIRRHTVVLPGVYCPRCEGIRAGLWCFVFGAVIRRGAARHARR